MKIFNITLVLVALTLILASPASADWLNLTGAENSPTIAEIYIHDDHIKVVLEIYIGDLLVFQRLLPDDVIKDFIPTVEPENVRLRQFFREDFQFVTETGKKLRAKLELLEPRLRIDRMAPYYYMRNPYLGFRPTKPPEDKRVLYAELIYPFENKPQELTIIPPLDENGDAKCSIGFIAYHKAVPIIDFRYLSQAEKLNLQWDDPWYSEFENRNLTRHHKIGLLPFLYVEPYEVRLEVLTRVKDMEAWMDLGLRGDQFIEPDEFEPLKQKIGEFFLDKNPVLVDGQALRPILDRTDYIRIGLSGIEFLRQPELLEKTTAIVGVIITYLTEGLPQEVTVDWELFTERIQRVPTSATDPAGPFISYVTPDDNVLKWSNYLKNFTMPVVEGTQVSGIFTRWRIPVASVLLLVLIVPVILQIKSRRRKSRPVRIQYAFGILLIVGSMLLFPFFRISVAKPASLLSRFSQEESRMILHSLLRNVYRSFDFREESDIYDKLALSVSGDLLADIYLQNRKSFEIQRAGGAQAKVQEVEILDVSVAGADKPGALAFRSKWTAFGIVGHWGHVHGRKNQYEAIVTVEPVEGNWKITNLELLEEIRIDPMAQVKTSDSTQGP